MYFRGRSQRNLDPKGRLMLPPEFRATIGKYSPDNNVVLTTYDGCIVGFPWAEWEVFERKINAIPNATWALRNFRRLVLGGAEECVLDGQGRVRLSKELLKYAGISGTEVILMGQGTRFEVWSEERLEPILAENFDDVAKDLAESGIDFVF